MFILRPPYAIILLFLCSAALAQEHVDTSFTVTGTRDTILKLPHQFIISRTLTVESQPFRIAFRFEPEGSLLFLSAFTSDTLPHVIHVRYDPLPLTFKPLYARHRLLPAPVDSPSSARIERGSVLSSGDFFGPGFQRSGSIVRGVSVGSDRGLLLTSGLRLQFSGTIANDVEVIGALTDESSPIQPEGTTQTLREVDRIFIEIHAPDARATLGDFVLGSTRPIGVWKNSLGKSDVYTREGLLRFSRKLQGISVLAGSPTSAIEATAAVARGRYTTNTFTGIEGVQGPYRLQGAGGERDIIVVAGTERVYIDGVQIIRGEANEYIIDYARAEVTFTAKRFITSATRIVIDFEYSSGQYPRTLLAGKADAETGAFTWGITAVRESDNEDAPLALTLSESDKNILAGAGADRNKAARPNVTLVAPGKGDYVRVDTLIGADTIHYYRFARGDTLAKYNVGFTFVGQGKGDYRQPLETFTAGQFEYVGTGNGSYSPITFLPLPELHELGSALINFAPTDAIHVQGEYAFAQTSFNRFSSVPGTRVHGNAFSFFGDAGDTNVSFFGGTLPRARLSVRAKMMEKDFIPIDRNENADFARDWGIAPTDRSLERKTETVLRAITSFSPLRALSFEAEGGTFRRENSFRSERERARALWQPRPTAILEYAIENIFSDDAFAGERGSWLRQTTRVGERIGRFTPAVGIFSETRSLHDAGTDTLRSSSFRFLDIVPSLGIAISDATKLLSEVSLRREDSVRANNFQRASTSTTVKLGVISESDELHLVLDGTYRKRVVDANFRSLSETDIETFLIRSQTHYAPRSRWFTTDFYYDIASERSARFIRRFDSVAFGSGTYIYRDRNANGKREENEFLFPTTLDERSEANYIAVLVPTDDLRPSVDLKTNLRFRFEPSSLYDKNDSSVIAAAARALTSETFVRIEENSITQNPFDVLFLKPWVLLDDSTTIRGTVSFQQDVGFFENSSDFSLHYRYATRNGAIQLASGAERSHLGEHALRIRGAITSDLSGEATISTTQDNVRSPLASVDARRDIIATKFSGDVSYRESVPFEMGGTFSYRTARDNNVRADLSTLTTIARGTYSFAGRGRIRTELERSEVQTGFTGAFPYQLSEGLPVGVLWALRINAEYRFGGNLQALFVYEGRNEPSLLFGRRTTHSGRAEVRAFF